MHLSSPGRTCPSTPSCETHRGASVAPDEHSWFFWLLAVVVLRKIAINSEWCPFLRPCTDYKQLVEQPLLAVLALLTTVKLADLNDERVETPIAYLQDL